MLTTDIYKLEELAKKARQEPQPNWTPFNGVRVSIEMSEQEFQNLLDLLSSVTYQSTEALKGKRVSAEILKNLDRTSNRFYEILRKGKTLVNYSLGLRKVSS